MAVTSKPTLNKTSLNLGKDFGAKGKLGNVSGHDTSVSSAGHIKSLQSQRRVLGRVIETEGALEEVNVRIKNVEVTNDALVSQNREFKNSLTNIQERIGALESGQQAILDFQKDKAKIEEKTRKNEEQRLKRETAEKGLEDDGEQKDIEEKDPKVKESAKGAMGILDKLKRFFTFVVAGWFTDKTFKLIEAFQTGNKEMINKIGLKLLAGTAAVAGIFSMAVFGIGPVLLGIGKLIALVAGLLFNPVTLTALLIAIGVGGAIMGIRKLWQWGRKKAAGGEKFRDAHKKNNEKLKELKELGVRKDGKIKIKGKKGRDQWGDVMEHGTKEQKELWMSFKDEQERLDGIRDDMKSEIKETKKEYWKKIEEGGKGLKGDEKKAYWKKARQDWKAQKADIRAKHEGLIGESTGDGSNVGSTASGDTAASNIGPVEGGEGNVTVIPKFKEKTDQVAKGQEKGIKPIASGNNTNIYVTETQVQTNMIVG